MYIRQAGHFNLVSMRLFECSFDLGGHVSGTLLALPFVGKSNEKKFVEDCIMSLPTHYVSINLILSKGPVWRIDSYSICFFFSVILFVVGE